MDNSENSKNTCGMWVQWFWTRFSITITSESKFCT